MKFKTSARRPHAGGAFLRLWPARIVTSGTITLAAFVAKILHLRKAIR